MSDSEFSRRRFAQYLASGATGAALFAGGAATLESAAKADLDNGEKPLPPEEAYLLGLILRRYADERLDEAAILAIVKDIKTDVLRGRVLSKFPLTNADEPSTVFRA